MTLLPPLVIAVLSAAVLLLLLAHRKVNLGGAATLAFLLSAAIYGWVRSFAIQLLSEARLGDVPYRIERPLAALAGVPLQELLGWATAVGLSSYLADRLLRRCGGSADAWSTALAAGTFMAAVCLAVETAAVSAGWWSWSLGHSATGALRFPGVALVDWGFVALDFLLPFELWRRRAPLTHRMAGLLIFPIHLAGHALTAPLSARVPLSGFDLVHCGLVAVVAAAALRSNDQSPWPPRADERWRIAPLLAAGVLLATTSAQLLLLGEGRLLWAGAPLALAAVGAYAVRVEALPGARLRGSTALAIGLFFALLAAGLLVRLPTAIRARDFERNLNWAVAALAAGDSSAARLSLLEALRLRPAHPDASWLLGWIEMQAGRPAEARRHLEVAVALRPASVEAVRYLALLEIQQGRGAAALELLKKRRARHRGTPDLAYLGWVAAGGTVREGPAPATILATASAPQLRELFALALTLGDRPTQEACRTLDLERAAGAKLVPSPR
ncbi:MAG: tetratricopeptide repeat protein [Thermoanaerobaculia bacterium]